MAEYPGGKNGEGVWQKIINLMPPHRVYIEPFLGSGAIMRMKRPAERNIGADLDPRVVEKMGLWASYESDLPGGIVFYADSGRDVIERGWPAMPPFEFYVMDALEVLKAYPWRGDEFVYLDPPYVRSARRSAARIYKHEYSDDDHRALLELVIRLPCSIAISGYASALYSDALSEWRVYTFDAMTRRGKATEYVWMNYSETVKRHDYRYLGKDFRERERIKRKKNRFVGKLARMDPTERAALLWGLQESGLSD